MAVIIYMTIEGQVFSSEPLVTLIHWDILLG